MKRARLAVYAIVLAAAWFSLGRLWPANCPGHYESAGGVAAALGRLWPGNGCELEDLFLTKPRGEQDQALLALIAAGRQTSGSAMYNFYIFNRFSAIWRSHGKGGQSPIILEIGPGANLGQGLLLVASGAKKYTGLDLYQPPELYNRHSYAAAYDLLNLVAPQSIRVKADQIYSVKGEQVVFKPERMDYLFPRQSYDIRMPDGSVDFVFSHSVFEHITDPDKTVTAIEKVLRRGGISAHDIDLRDHDDFSKPLEFLKTGEASWQARYTGEHKFTYTNRKRLSDFVAATERSGLKILKVETMKVPMSEEIRRGLHADFQKYSLEDLAVVRALIVAEKP